MDEPDPTIPLPAQRGRLTAPDDAATRSASPAATGSPPEGAAGYPDDVVGRAPLPVAAAAMPARYQAVFDQPLSRALAIVQASEMEDLEAEKDLAIRAARLFASEIRVVCPRSLALVLSVASVYPDGWWVQGRLPQPPRTRHERHWPRRFPAPPFSSLIAAFGIDVGDHGRDADQRPGRASPV